MATSEQPFDDREERYFLAEILKDRAVPPIYLLECIRQLGIQPPWNEIALPNGRSVSDCQRAFDRLLQRNQRGYAATTRPEESSSAPATLKKRAQGVAPSKPAYAGAGGFSGFATVNDPDTPLAQSSMAQSPGSKLGKKRGRPSKAESELRRAEAAERGEVYVPRPKKPKPKPSFQGSATTAMAFPPGEEGESTAFGGFSAEETPAGSSSKKRARKPKAPKEPRENLEAFANAATSALGGPSETQHGPSAPQESITHGLPEARLLAGLHEHAEPAGERTTESGASAQPQHPIEHQSQPLPLSEQPEQPLQPRQPSPLSEQPLQQSPQPEAKAYQTPYQPHPVV